MRGIFDQFRVAAGPRPAAVAVADLSLALDDRAVVIGPRVGGAHGGGLYRAHFADDPDTPLVLKIWLPGDGAASDVEAARAASLSALKLACTLDHPGIVRTLGGGVTGGLCWWLSAWIPGLSFDRLSADEFTPEGFVGVMASAADALDYAHTRNVVHADLSPANLVWNAAAQRPVILDFGLARLGDAPHAAQGLFGTPATMAPERRSGAPASFMTDQYALARTLALLASPRAPGLPGHARAALVRATDPDPGRRFARVAGFAQALRETRACFLSFAA